MALEYVIRFTVGRFYVSPMGGDQKELAPGAPATPAYWAIVDENTRNAVAFAFEENQAQSICFALGLVCATLEGDKVKTREIMGALEKVARTGPRLVTPK